MVGLQMQDRQLALRLRISVGWLAVALSTLAACFWAFWGSIENFHEGWYHRSWTMNLAMMLGQYLMLTIVFIGSSLVAIRWPRVGGTIHMIAGLLAAWRFRGAAPLVIYGSITGPLIVMGFAYWFGRPEPRRWAAGVVIGLPLLIALICGAEPAWRVAGRFNDGILSARRLTDNGVDLIWAPRGPGWPDDGTSWEEAQRICRYLSEDGLTISENPENIWRLPTVEEAVRSMTRHNQNCRGTWDVARGRAFYQKMPDKESPLWDIHSKVIYWWTATELNAQEAYIIVYNGQVWPRPKVARWGYLGFRAVKDAK